jgi:hypothetical protein
VVLDILKDRDLDAATGFASPNPNPPASALRFNRVSNRWEEYDGTTWQGKVLSVAGGGTGAGDPSSARAALGIGTLGVQQSNALAVTGGSLTGITVLGMAGHITFAATNTYNIGSAAQRVGRLYVGGGAVAPVGASKWVPV